MNHIHSEVWILKKCLSLKRRTKRNKLRMLMELAMKLQVRVLVSKRARRPPTH